MRLVSLVALSLISTPVFAANMDKALLKLGPEERARQACVIKGIEQIRRDKRIGRPDFLSPGISKPATLNGSVVTAPAGAVRASHRWHAVSFTCSVTPDQMKALTFVYQLGAEIPKAQWADLGLWE